MRKYELIRAHARKVLSHTRCTSLNHSQHRKGAQWGVSQDRCNCPQIRSADQKHWNLCALKPLGIEVLMGSTLGAPGTCHGDCTGFYHCTELYYPPIYHLKQGNMWVIGRKSHPQATPTWSALLHASEAAGPQLAPAAPPLLSHPGGTAPAVGGGRGHL
jgi:hypothetical protein